jgi:hypothetical protein
MTYGLTKNWCPASNRKLPSVTVRVAVRAINQVAGYRRIVSRTVACARG